MIRYFVSRQGKWWAVLFEGRTMGRHLSREAAIRSAIVMADLMGAMKHDCDVMAEDESGSGLSLIWTYGVDPMPEDRPKKARKSAAQGHVKRVFPAGAEGTHG